MVPACELALNQQDFDSTCPFQTFGNMSKLRCARVDMSPTRETGVPQQVSRDRCESFHQANSVSEYRLFGYLQYYRQELTVEKLAAEHNFR